MNLNKELLNSWLVIFWWIGTWGVVNNLFTKYKLSVNSKILGHLIIMILALCGLYYINGSFVNPISVIM